MKLFGTDGIRGKAGVAPLEPATIARVGEALVRSLMDGSTPHRFVIGRDTRESGDWIERELARGLTSGGATVVSAGVVPTPAIAYLARTEGFDAGLVPIVVDCANGATAAMAPAFLSSLGFDVRPIGVSPDGRNINLDCGSTHLAGLANEVLATGAGLGIAFDGDGDRALFVDAAGKVVDGDAVLLIAALQMKKEGRLPGDTVVATVMSNIGLEMALRDHGISLVRTGVGDKYVMEEMVKCGYALGGEQSGHIIFAEHLFTGDGLATALNVLRIMVQSGRDLADLAGELVTYPQVLVNVRVKQRSDYTQVPAIATVIDRVERGLAGHGRLLIRYSGTEPLLRIMLEGQDQAEIRGWAADIAAVMKEQLA